MNDHNFYLFAVLSILDIRQSTTLTGQNLNQLAISYHFISLSYEQPTDNSRERNWTNSSHQRKSNIIVFLCH